MAGSSSSSVTGRWPSFRARTPRCGRRSRSGVSSPIAAPLVATSRAICGSASTSGTSWRARTGICTGTGSTSPRASRPPPSRAKCSSAARCGGSSSPGPSSRSSPWARGRSRGSTAPSTPTRRPWTPRPRTSGRWSTLSRYPRPAASGLSPASRSGSHSSSAWPASMSSSRTAAGRSLPAEAVAEGAAPGIAVLPFTVQGAGLEVWREGMVDLLSTNLDGAGGLRAIDSRTVLARWSEAAGRRRSAISRRRSRSAAGPARAMRCSGAWSRSGDGVRLSAEVYDVEEAASSARARSKARRTACSCSSTGSRSRSCARSAGTRPPPADVNLARATTTSLPALKAFMEGEVLYRRGDFDAAVPAYERAVEADSTFALANFRLSTAYGWAESRSRASSPPGRSSAPRGTPIVCPSATRCSSGPSSRSSGGRSTASSSPGSRPGATPTIPKRGTCSAR